MKAKYIGDPSLLMPCEYQGTDPDPNDYCNHCDGAINVSDDPEGVCPIMGWDREINPKVKDLFEVEE
jgi:hypothetical protein